MSDKTRLEVLPEAGKRYPCGFPFSQLYAIPREELQLSFCSYHPGVVAENQTEFYQHGTEKFNQFFRNNEQLKERREKFLQGDFTGAGCSPDCYWLNQWKTSGKGYEPEDFRDPDGEFHVSRMWLTVGPDCNITCRYCLEPKKFEINFNTCDPTVMDTARALIVEGGSVLLTGGEPFLPKFRLVPTLAALAATENVQGWFEIHTNGMYLKPEVRELVLRAPVKTVNVSMDTLRKELFEYLRRGAKFDVVWGNLCALQAERDAQKKERPSLVVLCAVMKSTYDHITETVERAVDQGLAISLNALFQGYFSPDFCREEGLHNLSEAQLGGLHEALLRMNERYGSTGLVQSQGLAGQVENLLAAKREGRRGPQVVLGRGNEAPRKGNAVTLLRQGRLRAACGKLANTARQLLTKVYRRVKR